MKYLYDAMRISKPCLVKLEIAVWAMSILSPSRRVFVYHVVCSLISGLCGRGRVLWRTVRGSIKCTIIIDAVLYILVSVNERNAT